jgi:hypothetical protein
MELKTNMKNLYCRKHSNGRHILGNIINAGNTTNNKISAYTRWFKYDRDDLCVNKSQFVPVIFEPPCRYSLVSISSKNLYVPCSGSDHNGEHLSLFYVLHRKFLITPVFNYLMKYILTQCLKNGFLFRTGTEKLQIGQRRTYMALNQNLKVYDVFRLNTYNKYEC